MTTSAAGSIALVFSVEDLFQGTLEYLVACSVDEWIQTRVDETDHRELVEMSHVHYCDLLEMHERRFRANSLIKC